MPWSQSREMSTKKTLSMCESSCKAENHRAQAGKGSGVIWSLQSLNPPHIMALHYKISPRRCAGLFMVSVEEYEDYNSTTTDYSISPFSFLHLGYLSLQISKQQLQWAALPASRFLTYLLIPVVAFLSCDGTLTLSLPKTVEVLPVYKNLRQKRLFLVLEQWICNSNMQDQSVCIHKIQTQH